MALSWGVPKITLTPITGEDEEAMDAVVVHGTDIVEDSTELASEDGDTIDATVEGGSKEDVRYKDTTYNVNFNVRKSSKRDMPLENDIDWNTGLAQHEYKLELEPERVNTYGFVIAKCKVHVTPVFTANDGLTWQYACESLSAGDDTKNITFKQKV